MCVLREKKAHAGSNNSIAIASIFFGDDIKRARLNTQVVKLLLYF